MHKHTPTIRDPSEDRPPRHRSRGKGCLAKMFRLKFKVTHTSTHRTFLLPMSRLTHRENNVLRGQAQHPMEGCSCPLSHPPTEVQMVQPPPATTCQEGWEELAVFSPLPPCPSLSSPPALSAHGRSLILRRGLWFLCCDLSFPQGQLSPLWPVLRRLEGRGWVRGWCVDANRGEGWRREGLGKVRVCSGLWARPEGKVAQTS